MRPLSLEMLGASNKSESDADNMPTYSLHPMSLSATSRSFFFCYRPDMEVDCLLPSCGTFNMEISSQESNRPDNGRLSISQQLMRAQLLVC